MYMHHANSDAKDPALVLKCFAQHTWDHILGVIVYALVDFRVVNVASKDTMLLILMCKMHLSILTCQTSARQKPSQHCYNF